MWSGFWALKRQERREIHKKDRGVEGKYDVDAAGKEFAFYKFVFA